MTHPIIPRTPHGRALVLGGLLFLACAARSAEPLPAKFTIVGNAALAGAFAGIGDVYRQSHPGAEITFISGDDGTAMAALTFGSSPIAPMTGEYTAAGLTAVRKLVGPDPLAIRIGYASADPAAPVGPPAIVVNKDNPLTSLSVEQVQRIFCTGAPKSDITGWGQLGLKGEWSMRPIHPCGLPESDIYESDDVGMGAFLVAQKMPGLHFNHVYETYAHYDEVLQRIRGDRSAIGIVALNRVKGDVRIVGLANDEWSPVSSGSAADLASGRYPFNRSLYVYLLRTPGHPLDPLAVSLARTILSEAGQQALAAERSRLIPLNPADRAAELAKLQ